MGEYDEQFIFEMGYNKGFKDGIKGSIPKDQYEARLKADMVAMLEDLKKEIKKLDTYDIERTHGLIEDSYVTTDVNDIIQQKIDALKGEK